MPDPITICVSVIAIPIVAIITLWPQIYIRIARGGDTTYHPRSASIHPTVGVTLPTSEASLPTSTNPLSKGKE